MADEDPKHLARLRELPCAVQTSFPERWNFCEGHVAPHHSTHGRGMGQRVHDHEAMPLCMRHHFEFHAATGFFAEWNHEQRTEWQKKMVEVYRPKNDPEVF